MLPIPPFLASLRCAISLIRLFKNEVKLIWIHQTSACVSVSMLKWWRKKERRSKLQSHVGEQRRGRSDPKARYRRGERACRSVLDAPERSGARYYRPADRGEATTAGANCNGAVRAGGTACASGSRFLATTRRPARLIHSSQLNPSEMSNISAAAEGSLTAMCS